MKTRHFTLIALVAVITIFGTACGKKKKKAAEAPKPKGEVLINEYCTGDQYMSTKDAFRATATGESMDRETAKKKARSNANAELAKTINTTMKIVGDNYVNSTEFNNKEEVTETFQEMARTVVDQELRGAVEICEKLTQREDGVFVSYVAIELSGQKIADAYSAGLSQNEKIKADYNYEKFKETFEKEMDKMANERK
ncbi:MAG: LPP20 family lipoprotein [Flavobacteriales bacterium]|nr:LPP20 family lipoprotein [Flavobacteriales bacterium]